MISAIILAAGKSERMEGFKQLLKIGNRTMVETVVSSVMESKAEDMIVVLGYRADDVYDVLPEGEYKIVFNPDFEEGMGTSLKRGVDELSAETEAFLVVLADQPFLEPETIDEIINEYERAEPEIVAPAYGGTRGNPVLIDCSLRERIMDIEGDMGAREILGEREESVSLVEISSPSVLFDVNTEEDYKKIQRHGKNIEAIMDAG